MSAKGSLNIRKGYWKLMFLPLFAYLDIPNVDGQGLTRLDFKPGQVGLECLAVRAMADPYWLQGQSYLKKIIILVKLFTCNKQGWWRKQNKDLAIKWLNLCRAIYELYVHVFFVLWTAVKVSCSACKCPGSMLSFVVIQSSFVFC